MKLGTSPPRYIHQGLNLTNHSMRAPILTSCGSRNPNAKLNSSRGSPTHSPPGRAARILGLAGALARHSCSSSGRAAMRRENAARNPLATLRYARLLPHLLWEGDFWGFFPPTAGVMDTKNGMFGLRGSGSSETCCYLMGLQKSCSWIAFICVWCSQQLVVWS